ncbi:unnamed protein product [Diamesa serratosioi]
MSPPTQKRCKINAKDVLDPIVRFSLENISIEYILDFFTEEDLLNASLVSYLWYERIGQSKNFKKKVVIKVGRWKEYFLPKSVLGSHALRDSVRKYESFVNYNQIMSNEVNFLATKAWKSVTTNINTYTFSSKFVEYVQMFSSTVEKLEIIKANIIFKDSSAELCFPRLKQLEILNVNTNVLEELVGHHPQLTTFYLKVRHIERDDRFRELVIRFLKLNYILNRLELSCFSDLFEIDVTQHLSLQLYSFKYQMKRAMNQSNFSKFLQSIGPSLKRLEFTIGYEIQLMLNKDFMFIYDSWNSMKSLEFLEINLEYKEMYLDMDIAVVNKMEVSKTIKHIEMTIGMVPFTRSVCAMIQILLFGSCDTLEILELSHVTINMLEFIINYLPRLKTLIAGAFSLGCRKYYKICNRIQGAQHNRNIRLEGDEVETIENNENYAVSGYYSDHNGSGSSIEGIGNEADNEEDF